MKVSDEIALWIAKKGITHAFGIVGGGNVAQWDAITRLGQTELITTHHEQAAAMSASYFYRTAKKIALCLVTTGAGSTNALTGVMAAWMDHTPLIVLSGNEDSKHFMAAHPRPRVAGVQGYDSALVASPFCKWTWQFKTPAKVSDVLDHAYDTALQPTSGPVWLDLPKDIANSVAA